MNLIAWLLVLIMAANPASAADTKSRKKKKPKSFLERLFTPNKPKVVDKSLKKRPASKIKSKPVAKESRESKEPKEINRNADGFFIVDTQWYANYLEHEMAWSYPIPEDQDIKFVNGKYHVPPVVYRHYEDMVNTPRPTPAP